MKEITLKLLTGVLLSGVILACPALSSWASTFNDIPITLFSPPENIWEEAKEDQDAYEKIAQQLLSQVTIEFPSRSTLSREEKIPLVIEEKRYYLVPTDFPSLDRARGRTWASSNEFCFLNEKGEIIKDERLLFKALFTYQVQKAFTDLKEGGDIFSYYEELSHLLSTMKNLYLTAALMDAAQSVLSKYLSSHLAGGLTGSKVSFDLLDSLISPEALETLSRFFTYQEMKYLL